LMVCWWCVGSVGGVGVGVGIGFGVRIGASVNVSGYVVCISI